MRKVSMVAAAAVLMLALSACSSENTSGNEPADTPQSEVSTDTPQTEEAADTEQSEEADSEADTEQSEEKVSSEESAQDFTDMEIEVSTGTLYIRSGDDFSITSHNGKTLDYEISGGTLSFKNDRAEEIVLVLPEKESYEMLDLTLHQGHIYVEGALNVSRLNLEVEMGEVSLENITVSESSSITVNSGSASLHGNPGAQTTAVCRQGNLNLAVPFEEEACNYEISLSGGNITVGKHEYNGKSETYHVDNGGEYDMDLSCTHGHLSVVFGK